MPHAKHPDDALPSSASPPVLVRHLNLTDKDSKAKSPKEIYDEFVKPGSGCFSMDFCTLGMFIIDEIYYPPPKPPVRGIIGGAGSYAALGARLLRPHHPELVGWVVHKGFDFPNDLLEQINSWDTACQFIETPNRATTRGWNKYEEDEHRDFKYLTPKMRVTHAQLPGAHLLSKCYHLICTASRCIELVKGILEARAKLRQENKIRLVDELKPFDPPLFVWEPVPDSCVPSEMLIVLEALRHVDVISPNHHELASLFGETGPDPFMASELQVLERQCNELLSRGFGKKPSAVVVRRGERGCYVASNIRHTWFPAYHRPRDELNRKEQRTWTQKVVDPTGGGNAFLGGYCIGLLDLHLDGETEFERGAIHGTIAASFAIEQVGMPQLSHADDGRELWNGEWVGTRWEKYCKNLPLDRLDLNQSKEASLYGSVSSVIFGTKITRMTRIPADFEGNRHVPKD